MIRQKTGKARPARLLSPAKINLYLKVLGRRADGYHELDTVMARLDLADVLTLEFGEGEDKLETAGGFFAPFLPPAFDGPFNLMMRAVRAYREIYPGGWPRLAVKMTLEKNIPIGAGLGGGSSNCATVLSFLNDRAPVPLPLERLMALGLSLGADVPFFLQERTLARARGLGELLTDAPSPYSEWDGREIVLVNPACGVSTASVFKTLDLTNSPPKHNLGPLTSPAPGENDLLPPAALVAPKVTEAAQAVEALAPRHWGLSGSGATFWLASDNPARDVERLLKEHCGWWIETSKIATGSVFKGLLSEETDSAPRGSFYLQ